MPLTPLAQRRYDATVAFAKIVSEWGAALVEDAADPENQIEEALTGEDWAVYLELQRRILTRVTVEFAEISLTDQPT